MSVPRSFFPKRTIPLLFGMGAIAMSAGLGYHYYREYRKPNSLWKTLDYYGFKQLEQKQALEFLMTEAGIIKRGQSFRETFPERNDGTLLLKDMLRFVTDTQKDFTIRKGQQERWDVVCPPWIKENQTKVLEALITLNVINEQLPTFPNPDVIGLLGAAMGSMAVRMDCGSSLYHKGALRPRYLVLLTGQRIVTPREEVDGPEAILRQLAEKYHTDLSKLTETHLMRELYSQSGFFNRLPTDIIDTPAGDLPRPTTEMTVQAFCQWLREHPDVESVTFISSQPHIGYQKAVIAGVLRYEGVNIKFEVIGPKASPEVIMSPEALCKAVGGLGSQIWAKTPGVIIEAGITVDGLDQVLIDSFKELYANKQPLLYKNIESLFSNPIRQSAVQPKPSKP